jgi:hypothetical protein
MDTLASINMVKIPLLGGVPVGRGGSDLRSSLHTIDRQPSIASCRIDINSSQLSPSVAQPGIAGTSAQKPPSIASWTITVSFIGRSVKHTSDFNTAGNSRGSRSPQSQTAQYVDLTRISHTQQHQKDTVINYGV